MSLRQIYVSSQKVFYLKGFYCDPHLLTCFVAETIDLYINGTGSGAEGSATDAVGVNDTTTDTILFLGRDRNSYFEGFIDEVCTGSF